MGNDTNFSPLYLIKSVLGSLCLFAVAVCYGQTDTLQTCSGCCCETDQTPAGVMISHVHEKGEFMISYRFMNMNMSGMQDGTSSVSDEVVFQKYLMSSSNMRMDMHMLMGMYGITSKITVMAMLHYNFNSMDMTMLPGTEHTHVMDGTVMGNEQMEMTMRTSGFGDTKLHLLYSILNSMHHHVVAAVGVSMPTGSIYEKGGDKSMYPNQRYPYAMQLGSGTWDLLPCASYLYQQGKWAASTQVSAVIRTVQNDIGYTFGNEITSNTWLAYRFLRPLSASLRMEATRTGTIQGKDKSLYAYSEPAAHSKNYGGDRVMAFVGAGYLFQKGILANNKLNAEYGIPVYQDLNGPQMPIQSAINASWSYVF